jgi:hypothetical protein
MVLQIENVDDALPHCLALENLFDGLHTHPHSRPALLAFYSLLKLVGAHFHAETPPILGAYCFSRLPSGAVSILRFVTSWSTSPSQTPRSAARLLSQDKQQSI